MGYQIINTGRNVYSRLIICDCLEIYLIEIEDDLRRDSELEEGLVLITDSSRERYLSCMWLNGKLNIDTALDINPIRHFKEL